MVNLASKVRLPRRAVEKQGQDGAVLGISNLAGRFPIYWLALVAVLAVGNTLLSIWFAGGTTSDSARDGVRFNLLTLGIALALSIGIGIVWPRWWRGAIAILALGPVPILLVTSGNLATGCATLLLAFFASWLGRETAAAFLGKVNLATGWAIGATLGLGLIAAYGFVAGMLGQLHRYTTWTVLALVALGLVAKARTRLRREARGFALWLTRPAEQRLLHLLLAGVALACFWLNLLGALAPETRSDAVRQRLAVAVQFARNGNLQPADADLFVAKEPAVGEIAYAAAITLSSPQAANILHFITGLACALAVFALAARVGGSLAGGLASAAFYCTLMAGWLSESAYLDLLPTLLGLTAALLLALPPRLGWRVAAAAGICVGLGVGVKLHFAYIAVGLGVTAGIIVLRSDGMRRAIQIGTIMAGSAILVVSPWIARVYSLTGSIPGVALGASALSAGAGDQSGALFDTKSFGIGRSLWDFVVLPFTTTLLGSRFGGDHFDTAALGGQFGYVLLGVFPLLFMLRNNRRAVALLAGAAISTFLWFYTAQYLRYGLPIIAIALALAGVTFVQIQRSLATSTQRKFANVMLCILILSGATARLQLPDIAHRYAFGLQSRDSFLTENLGGYAELTYLKSVPGVARILVMWDGPRLYSNVRMSSPFTTAGNLGAEGPDEAMLQYLREGGYSHILLDRRAASIQYFGWDHMTITNEDFLRRYTTLVAGGDYVYLYRILSPEEIGQAPAWAQGHELLPNGSFEEGEATHPSTWDLLGDPQYDRTGSESRTGQGAVRLAPGQSITATVPVRSGQTYLLAGANHGIDDPGIVELRIEWRDSGGETIATGGEKVISSPRGYRAYSILATSPQQAATAVVSVRTVDGQAWIDDLSLRSVAPDEANTSQPTDPIAAR